jgi:hypothetical protein
MSAVRVRHRPPFFFFSFDFVAAVGRSCAVLAFRLSVRGSACGPLTLPPLCSADLSPRGEGINWRRGAFPSFVCHRNSYRSQAITPARESQGASQLPFSPAGRRGWQADEGAARRFASISKPATHTSGHPAPPLAQARQNATAVIFRTGSGGRLTSRCCHEDTWPFFFPEIFDSIRPAGPPPATAP